MRRRRRGRSAPGRRSCCLDRHRPALTRRRRQGPLHGNGPYCRKFLPRGQPEVLPDCCPAARWVRLLRQHKIPFCRQIPKTGATGLEPATSGVTGHFEGLRVNDHKHGIAQFMRAFRAVTEGLAWLRRAVWGVCCPIAAPEDVERDKLWSLPLRVDSRSSRAPGAWKARLERPRAVEALLRQWPGEHAGCRPAPSSN